MLVLLVFREFGFILLFEFEIVIMFGDEGEFGILMGEEVCLVIVLEGLFFW